MVLLSQRQAIRILPTARRICVLAYTTILKFQGLWRIGGGGGGGAAEEAKLIPFSAFDSTRAWPFKHLHFAQKRELADQL